MLNTDSGFCWLGEVIMCLKLVLCCYVNFLNLLQCHHFAGFGYVAQQPWLQRGTVRENILFGKSFEHNKYK